MWWREAIVYQIYVRSFQDTDGDGIGDLSGIISRLDHLVHLGVDTVWLTPFYPSPMRDFGYDVSDHTGVHPLFGNLETFDRLIRVARSKGLRVLVDFVPNHTSDEHPWFADSRSSRTSTKRNWYVWRDPKPDGSQPNNWLGAFGGRAWTLDEKTGQYYRHSFLSSMPDLEWRNPEVKAAMLDVVRFWLDRGVSGIRIDAAQYPMKDPEMRDNPPNTERVSMHRPLGEFDSQLHVHDMGHPDIHDLYKELRAELDGYGEPARIAIGEIHVFDWPRWAAYYGGGADELHMVFNFGLLGVEWTAESLVSLIKEIETVLPEQGWANWVLGNHDEPRIASKVGGLARAAAMIQLTLRGTPTIYYGDELGLPDASIGPDRIADPWGLQAPELSRDPARSPMPWDASPTVGFCRPDSTPWLPLVEGHQRFAVETQHQDPSSFLSFTRRLIGFRQSSRALTSGRYGRIAAVSGCLVFERVHEEERCLVAINLTTGDVDLEIGERGVVEVSTRLDRRAEVAEDRLHLRAEEGCVLRLE